MRFLIPVLLLLFLSGLQGCQNEHNDEHHHTHAETKEEGKQKRKREHKADHEAHKQAPVFHASHEARKADAPFSDAVEVGDLYFLSGQIGIDNDSGELVEGGVVPETRQTMENIRDVLAQHQLEMGDVVKALVVLGDMADFAAFNEVYREYLPQKPARTTFAAKGLARGAAVEVEVVAVRSRN